MLQAREVEVFDDTHDLGFTHMTTHQAAHVKLWIHLDKCLIDNHTALFTLVVRMLEATSVHHLETKELQEIIVDRKHFSKNLLPVDGTPPTHLSVGDDHIVGKSHVRDGGILHQFVF